MSARADRHIRSEPPANDPYAAGYSPEDYSVFTYLLQAPYYPSIITALMGKESVEIRVDASQCTIPVECFRELVAWVAQQALVD